MSLTNRVCTYFLVALSIILAVYSLVFYSVTRDHVDDQFIGELRGVLNSLIAAAEVEETEVKWQPLEHSIDVGAHDELGEVHWIVVGDDNLVIERSRSAASEFLSWAEDYARGDSADTTAERNTAVRIDRSDDWVVMSQRVAAPRPTRQLREFDEFDQLTVVVGRSTGARDALLFRLTLLVILLPLLAWSIAALLGRGVVRKALRPLTAMADQAQKIAGTDFHTRLSHSESGDELTELGTAFNRLLDRQQAAFEQQRRFTGDAAHELRTPITVLLGQIDVTLRRARSESEYQAQLERLRTDTQSLQEIVESLLFLARSDADTDPPPLRTIELKSWLETHADSWSAHSRADDLLLDIRQSEPAWVRGTPALLGRIVDNLVFNALKYSDAATPIVVRLEQQAGQALIQVLDSGPGIADDEIPQLFDPFFRSPDARRRGTAGTGLGLAIASRIAETLGGSLTCESTPGQGSCFTLCLPAAEEASAAPIPAT